MNTSKNLIKNTLIIFLGKVFTQLLSFFLLPLYTTILSTEDYGFADFIFVIGVLVSPIIILQLDAGLFRSLIEIRDNRQNIKNTTGNVFCLSFIFFCIYAILYIFVCFFIQIRFHFLILFYVFTTIELNLILQFYRGIGNNIMYSTLCCINGAFTIVANIIFLLILKMGVEGMIFAYIIGQGFAFIVGISYFLILYRELKFNLNLKNILYILKYSIPLVFNGISWWVMNASDRVIIIAMLGLGYNGVYSVSNKFSSVMYSAYSILNLSWTEIVSTKYVINGIDNEILKLNEQINLAILYICGLLISSMYIVYPLFVNSTFSDGVKYIPILIMAVFFNCLGAQLGGLLVAKKDSKIIAKSSGLAAILNICINILFIRILGLYAAAVSTLISFFIMYILRRLRLKSELGSIKIKKYILPISLFLVTFVTFYLYNQFISTLIFFINIIVIFFVYRSLIIKVIYILNKRGKSNDRDYQLPLSR